MKTNNATLETQLEARCSTSQPRIYYSLAGTNELSANDASFETSVAGWETYPGHGTLLTRITSDSKYGDAAMQLVYDGDEEIAIHSLTNYEDFRELTMTFSVRLKGETAAGATVYIHGKGSTAESSSVTLSTSAWRLFQVTRVTPADEDHMSLGIRTKVAGSSTIYADGAKLENATVASNWSTRFFDVDDIKSDGVSINATEFSTLLRGRIEWGHKPDESAPAPLMAYTSELRFEIEDDGSTLSNWTKQGTGVHLRLGATTSTAYGDCTPAFHGIIWDWELVEGTQNHYRVVCYGLEKLWQEQKVSADAIDGPRQFGIAVETATTSYAQHCYFQTATQHFIAKATYDGQEVNKQNHVVCKWAFDTTTNAKYLTHFLFPIVNGKSLVAEHFTGKSYSDVIEYFESATGITGNMPETRMGHTGDTLTATLGPWAHLEASASAWRSLADAAGRKYYGYRYNDNGQIVLKSLAAARSAEAVTRSTASAGQIRNVQRLDDTYRVNDATIEYNKFGVDSATGAIPPVQTSTSYIPGTVAYASGGSTAIATIPHTPDPICPRINTGACLSQRFADSLAISDGTDIDATWEGREVANGAITIAGNDLCLLDCASTTDACFIESIAAMDTSYAVFIKVSLPNNTEEFKVGVATAKGADANLKLECLFQANGYLKLKHWLANGTLLYLNLPGATPAWEVGDVDNVTYAAGTYWVVVIKHDGIYTFAIMDTDFIPPNNLVVSGANSDLVAANLRAGDDYIQIGQNSSSAGTCAASILEVRHCEPAEGYAYRVEDDAGYGWGWIS